MRTVNFLWLGIVFIGVASLSSCKKEDRINKNLWKGDGVWNIDVYDFQSTSTYYQSDNYTDYKINAGTIEFKKDGTGTYKFPDSTIPMVYTNTDKTLTIRFLNENGVPDDYEKQEFEIDWKKNQMELKSYTVDTYTTSTGTGGTVSVTYTQRLDLKLSKK